MKVNPVLTAIAVLLSCVLTYMVYSLCNDEEEYKALLCVCSFLSFASTLSVAIGVSFLNTRANVNIKITSLLCVLILLISNISFALVGVNDSALIIITALVLLLFLLLAYLLPKKGI